MKAHKFTEIIYNDVAQLAREHDATSLAGLGREFYDRTRCGISTQFLSLNDDPLHYEDASPRVQDDMPRNQWPIRNCIGVRLSTIVEGSDAEFSADDLLFPFSDQELAEAWDYLEAEADATFRAQLEEIGL